MFRIVLFLHLILAAAGSAWADDASDLAQLRAQLTSLTSIRSDRLLEQIQYVFVNVDRNGDGIAGDEIVAARDADNAAMRSMRLSQAVGEIARNDLDGNGTVTRAEIETSARYSSSRNRMYSGTDAEAAERLRATVARLTDNLLGRYDFNQDGKVELTEVIAAPTDKLARKSGAVETSPLQFHLKVAEALLPFDADKNGRVSEVEAMAAIARAFQQ